MGKEQGVSGAISLGVKKPMVLRSDGRSLLSSIHTSSSLTMYLKYHRRRSNLAAAVFDSGGAPLYPRGHEEEETRTIRWRPYRSMLAPMCDTVPCHPSHATMTKLCTKRQEILASRMFLSISGLCMPRLGGRSDGADTVG